jgi:poly(A) polymerase/tRNA nucleotidyltransferase (CCA-adding enzyme)
MILLHELPDLPDLPDLPGKFNLSKQLESNIITPNMAKSIHKYCIKHGNLAVAMVLLTIAETLSSYGTELTHNKWEQNLYCLQVILNSYFDRYNEIVEPIRLINGNDLIDEFKNISGISIGKILNLVTEAQVAGEISNKETAIDFARHLYESNNYV